MKVFAVYDMAAGAYLAPFFQPNDAVAIRLFANMVNDGKSLFWASPGDFSLHLLGEFDEQSGLFTCDKGPQGIRSALSVVKRDVDERQVPLFDKDAALAAMQKSIGFEDKENPDA